MTKVNHARLLIELQKLQWQYNNNSIGGYEEVNESLEVVRGEVLRSFESHCSRLALKESEI